MSAEFKRGKCAWCGDVGMVYADNGRCEECDSDTIDCVICGELQHRDNSCRHVFQCEETLHWAGSGTGWEPDEEVRDSFVALLDMMPPTFAVDLRNAIAKSRFHTFLIAPLIGGGGRIELHGIDWKCAYAYGKNLVELGEEDWAEAAVDGYCWLVSLYDGDTVKANRITLRWIDAWRDEGASIARWADDGGVVVERGS